MKVGMIFETIFEKPSRIRSGSPRWELLSGDERRHSLLLLTLDTLTASDTP
jgi:hypothetical protein